MKKILFVVALTEELKVIKEEINALKLWLKLWFKVDFLLSWVWNYNTINSLKDYIFTKQKPDFIINIWVCWMINNDFKDFFQVYRIKNIANNKEIICPNYLKILPLKSILSSEKIITDKNELQKEFFVDMESFAIDFICTKEQIPYIIIKKPFDIIWKDSKKVDINKLKDSIKWFDYKSLLQEINIFLEKNKSKNDFDKKIFDLKLKFRLTFCETEMLKKYINKCKAFWEDILFLDKNDLLIKIKS